MSVATLVSLSAALIELWIQRNEEKDQDYRLALSILKWLSTGGWFLTLLLTTNYAYRFYTGLTGSKLPGPIANSAFALASFVAVYAFLFMVGVVLMYLLWMSDVPTPEELERRDRIARRRLELETRRRQRREGRGRLRRGF
jgi:hypothetical protein